MTIYNLELAEITPAELGVKSISINQLKNNGEVYFQLKLGSNTIYKINHYDRSSKSYSISPVTDINKERFIKSNRQVFIGFDY